jgi:palmitoyltransferase
MVTHPGKINPARIKNKSKQISLKDNKVIFCKKCEKERPERSHHCSTCKQCVLKMDHHCPWVNNCIGLENRRYFINFLLFLAVGLFFMLFTLASIRHHYTFKFEHN